MSDRLNARLATDRGRRDFDGEMAALLRVGHHQEAERRLAEALAVRPGAIADVCRATPAEAVVISGWDRLHRELDRLARVTAIGFNLSNHGDAEAGAAWHDKEPAIETGYYSDDGFQFSGTPFEVLRAAAGKAPTPWQGCMDDVPGPPPVALSGLRALNSLLLEYDNDAPWRPTAGTGNEAAPAPDEAVAFAAGQWFLHLRFHQAMVRELSRHGLPRALPVLLGEHDVGPFVRAVVMGAAGKAPDQAPATASTPSPAPEPPDPGQAFAGAFIAEMRSSRNAIRRCGMFDGARKRDLIAEAQDRERQVLDQIGLAWPSPSWEGSDTQFEAFAYTVRICCDLPPPESPPKSTVESRPASPPASAAAARPAARGGFGRKGLN